MAGLSEIEWTEATWNPVAGCSMVSPGCTNCYAQRMAARLNAMGVTKYAGTTRTSGRRAVWTGRVTFDESAFAAPLRWRRPLRIFVNSMSDLFQSPVPESFVRSVWEVMEQAHWHTFQILTKRPERMRDVLKTGNFSTLEKSKRFAIVATDSAWHSSSSNGAAFGRSVPAAPWRDERGTNIRCWRHAHKLGQWIGYRHFGGSRNSALFLHCRWLAKGSSRKMSQEKRHAIAHFSLSLPSFERSLRESFCSGVAIPKGWPGQARQ